MNWISIKDQKPEHYQTVLVTDGEDIEQAVYVNYKDFKWRYDDVKFHEKHITHWCEIKLP